MHSSCMPRLSLCPKASISGKNMILFVEVLSHDEFSRSHQFWVSYPMFAIFPKFRATPCYQTRAISNGFSPFIFPLQPIVPLQDVSHRRSLPISSMCAG